MYEFIEGCDLTGLIQEYHQKKRLSAELATQIVHRLASIIAVAHRLNPPLVHRDLKPSNILVRRSEGNKIHLFVADFGIGGLAAKQAIQEQGVHSTMQSQSLPAAIRGAYTPLYASPQQVQGDKPDPRDDVHALGVIWYQLLTGNLSLTSIPPDWRDVVEERGLDLGRIAVLSSCLASRSEKRPADAFELAERLKAIATPPPPPDDPRPLPDDPPPPPGSRKEQTMKVLQRHGLLSEGTPIEPMPDSIELIPNAIAEIGPENAPKVFQARMGNPNTKKSIIWEYDGNAYSLTELSCKLEQYGLWWIRPKTFELWRIVGQTESMWDQAEKHRLEPGNALAAQKTRTL
jgi:serine/threonine protein kinase